MQLEIRTGDIINVLREHDYAECFPLDFVFDLEMQ